MNQDVKKSNATNNSERKREFGATRQTGTRNRSRHVEGCHGLSVLASGFSDRSRAPATTLPRPSHTPTTNPNTTMSAVTMNAITVKASAFTAGRVSLRAKSAVAAKPRGMTVMAYKVTLETPEGTQEIECADDTYVLDAAEVRALLGEECRARIETRDDRTRA